MTELIEAEIVEPAAEARVAGAREVYTRVTSAEELEVYTRPWQPAVKAEATIGCIIPAYNEEETIERVLHSLLSQTRVPDQIHVIINNTTDETFWLARELAGEHVVRYRDSERTCKVFVHDIGQLPERKVGALNIGFALVEDCDYLLGVDGDTILERDTVARLLAEIMSDTRIGGISAIYSIDATDHPGMTPGFLVAGQRQQFASFNLANLLRGRNMAVLGGQCSIFSVDALKAVQDEYRQLAPWVSDSEVEDSLLSLQLKSLGYATKISASARANVGAMTTVKSLDAQQVKWNYGGIDLMWPGQRGNTEGQPFHPNLRLRWMENVSMVFNIGVRLGFLMLVLGSLSIHALVFHWWWILPPVVAVLLNVRLALSMHDRTWRDVLFAALFVPGEVYMWLRMGHFLRAWTKFLSRQETDNWAAQAAAESGRGGSGYLQPLIAFVAVIVVVAVSWFQLPLIVQESVLWILWPMVGAVTVVQTLAMLRKLLQAHRGFTV